ncbi:gibberellin 20-oxidase [Aspergillus flavus]|nr:gibberellin 20-oxidase [Aspergillus flavus]
MTEVARQPSVPDGASSSTLRRYVHVPETKHELDWADLVTLDLSQFDIPGGKEKLAAQLKDAVHNIGFFYVTNFGLSPEEIDRQFAIGQELFELPESEKLKHRADLEAGNYNGYRPLGAIEILPGLRDNIELYNVFKFIPRYARSHPEVILQHYEEIERFHRFIYDHIVTKLFRLIAILLELPEDYLRRGECSHQNLWSRGHTDFGSLTLLFRQPVAALQVKTPEGAWKYVKPYPNSITVNIADALQFWTNGYLKSSVHRVIAPPPDQAHIDRLGVLYFVRPGDGLDLKTVDSPLLRRLGLKKDEGDEAQVSAGEWVRARVRRNWDKPPKANDENIELGGVKTTIFHE